jgi:hypothetical protein
MSKVVEIAIAKWADCVGWASLDETFRMQVASGPELDFTSAPPSSPRAKVPSNYHIAEQSRIKINLEASNEDPRTSGGTSTEDDASQTATKRNSRLRHCL